VVEARTAADPMSWLVDSEKKSTSQIVGHSTLVDEGDIQDLFDSIV